MKKIFFLAGISISFFLVGCSHQQIQEPTTHLSGTILNADFTGIVSTVLLALKTQDLLTLAKFVGPQGLRFSPYQYINTGTDIVLSTEEVFNGLAISRSYTRGAYDGSGEPIDLGIGQYFEKFVSDADYASAPEIYYNQEIQRGNTINNISQAYSGKQWIEYYFPGFEQQYEGMDWKSLTLVFENINNQRYLIGIVHGSRTI